MAGGGIGPQIPPEVAARLGIRVQGGSDAIIGPTMPPAADNKEKEDSNSSSSSSSSSDEDEAVIGPAAGLAGCSQAQARQQTMGRIEAQMARGDEEETAAAAGSGRGEWMLVPPSSSNSRKGDALFDESWTQTPEQKQRRQAAAERSKEEQAETPAMRRSREEDEDKARWVDEFNRAHRPKSLMQMHQESVARSHHRKKSRAARGPADEWRQRRRAQNAALDTLGALGDKYAPGKSGSYL
ncbi:hypothetical protein H4R18_002349 [Coemansia javaensis]|uniref:DUF3752 domain-containing protein n=1 Tax=Coemansia javaensis TaxID=2761396 RepID=A0A9W8LK59_9FUNG|nr:hypothetical protein H4R18_002349 [Coemansia javaensis]